MATYRAIYHNTTGKSPAELLFSSRGKLPNFTMPQNDQDVRDHDAEQKGKNELYADHRRGAKSSPLDVGDHVLVRQEKTDKLTTAFSQVPYTVVFKKGISVTIEDSGGAQYKRNTMFVKKFFSGNASDSPVERQSQEETEPVKSVTVNTRQMMSDKMQSMWQMRPQRQTRLPERFKEFIVE